MSVLAILGPRTKAGTSVYSRRKVAKIQDESELRVGDLQWCKDYAAVLKACGYSYRYISDATNVMTSIVKAWFEDQEMWDKIAVVQKNMVEGGASHLQNQTVELVEMLLDMARRATDEAVRLRAIESALDRVGLSKVNKSESVVTKNERQEHDIAASLFEKMEGLPVETQNQLATMAVEMDKLVADSRGKE